MPLVNRVQKCVYRVEGSILCAGGEASKKRSLVFVRYQNLLDLYRNIISCGRSLYFASFTVATLFFLNMLMNYGFKSSIAPYIHHGMVQSNNERNE